MLTKIIDKDINAAKADELGEKYLRPENVKGMLTPKCNSEIWGKLITHTKSRDIKLQKTQKRISSGLCALAKTIDQLVKLKAKEPELKGPIQEALMRLHYLLRQMGKQTQEGEN